MNLKRPSLIICIAIIFGNCVYSQQSILLENTLKQLGLSKDSCFTRFLNETKHPSDSTKTIFIIPKIAHQEYDFIQLDCHIVVVKNETGKIISRFYEANKWAIDATEIESIKLDSNYFELNNSQIAFGVRVVYSGPSRVNPYYETKISFFVEMNENLIPILKEYSLNLSNGEWDGVCKGEFKSQKKRITLSNNITNGYRDIEIENNIIETVRWFENEDCKEVENSKQEKSVLKFNGTVYQNVL